jgi:hypothetical protein
MIACDGLRCMTPIARRRDFHAFELIDEAQRGHRASGLRLRFVCAMRKAPFSALRAIAGDVSPATFDE